MPTTSACLRSPRPTYAAPCACVDRPNETALWAPGATARIIGWGDTFRGQDIGSNELREANVPIAQRRGLRRRLRRLLRAATMVCAGAADPPASSDTCQGDSGGPLLVPDGGRVRARRRRLVRQRLRPTRRIPGVYTRVGDEPLNAWVHGRTPEADFDLSHQPRAGEPVTLTSTSPPPRGRRLLHDLPLGPRQRRRLRRRHRPLDLAHLPHRGPGGRRPRGLDAAAATRRRSTTRSTSSPPPAPPRDPPTTTPAPPATPPGRDRAARHDPRRQAAEGQARPLPDPHPLRQDARRRAPP